MDEKTLKKLADAYKQGNPEAKKAIDNLKKLALGQGEEAEKAKSILTAIQGYIKKAAKGAKLDYIKSLKHQCPEGEELYYYKKGGSVGCGCKKKEDGGEVKKDCGGSSIVSNFKKMRTGGKSEIEILSEKKTTTKPKYKTTSPDKNGEYTDNRGNIIITKKGMEEREKTLNANKNEEGKADPNRKQKLSKSNKTPIKACGSKIKKHQEGSVIDKFKALRKGGSLNGIPFYLGGTSKEGVLRSIYKNPQINYYELSTGSNPMWYRFAYPNQNYILSDNDLGKPGEGIVFVSDERVPGSYLGGTHGGWDPIKRKSRFNTPKTFMGSLYNTWEAFADSIRNANGFKPAQNRKVKK